MIRVRGAQVLAVRVYRRVPKVIDKAGSRVNRGPIEITIDEILQVSLRIECTAHPETHSELHQLLPERRVISIGAYTVRQIRAQVPVPVIHRHIGERAGLIVFVRPGRNILKRLTARASNTGTCLIVNIVSSATYRCLRTVPVAIRHHDVIRLAALQMRLGIVGSRECSPGTGVVSALEVATDLTHGRTQRCTASGGLHLQPVEKVISIGPFIGAHATDERADRMTVHVATAFVDSAVAQTQAVTLLRKCR